MPEGLSMSVGDVAVYLVAFVALAILAFGVINGLIRNWRDILSALGVIAVIGAIGGVAFLLLGAVLYVGVLAYGQISDQRMMQQCSTAHERRAKAQAAPDDYFGRQLLKAAADEAEECAKFAARKEAAANSAK
jgi:hypothetical protein